MVLAPLPADLAGQACLTEDEVRYICAQAAAIEAAEGAAAGRGVGDRPRPGVPDSVFFLQHRPETTWAAAEPPERPGRRRHARRATQL